MGKTNITRTGCLNVEKITLSDTAADMVLLYVSNRDEDDGAKAEEISALTGQTLYRVSYCISTEVVYPTPFMDLVRVWKSLIREGVDYRKSAMIGTGTGASVIISLSLWCRDHGIPLPSSLILDSPFLGNDPEDRVMRTYLGAADCDDPCAYPLLASYFLFPPVCLFDKDGRTFPLRKRLEEESIRYEYNSGEYISEASAFIIENMN